MGISSETPIAADKARAPHPVRLLIGRTICWFTDPVIEERERAAPLPRINSTPAAVIPETVDPAHLPIYTSGRRPPFFYDVPVRDCLISCLHRMTIDQARDVCISKFGAKRTPSHSAVHRFWQKLDQHATGANPVLKGRIEAAHRAAALGQPEPAQNKVESAPGYAGQRPAAPADAPVAEFQVVRVAPKAAEASIAAMVGNAPAPKLSVTGDWSGIAIPRGWRRRPSLLASARTWLRGRKGGRS